MPAFVLTHGQQLPTTEPVEDNHIRVFLFKKSINSTSMHAKFGSDCARGCGSISQTSYALSFAANVLARLDVGELLSVSKSLYRRNYRYFIPCFYVLPDQLVLLISKAVNVEVGQTRVNDLHR
jgi:hypothetical protein